MMDSLGNRFQALDAHQVEEENQVIPAQVKERVPDDILDERGLSVSSRGENDGFFFRFGPFEEVLLFEFPIAKIVSVDQHIVLEYFC